MARIVLMGLGSSGDVNPLLGLARALRDRGHETVVVAPPPFQRAAEGVGATFAPLGTAARYEALYAHPDLWHPRKGLGVFFPYAADLTHEGFTRVREALVPDGTVVVATFQCFGARLAHDVLDVPFVTALPNPILLQSVHDPSRNPIANPPRWMGRLGSRIMYTLVNREVHRHARRGINRARRALHLPPVTEAVSWTRSPQRVVGLWPSWFAAPQPDWPPQADVTGFITYDGPAEEPHDPAPHARPWTERSDWLVFTPGSQATHGQEFFRAATEAAAALDRPTLLVTTRRDHLPASLPPGVRHVAFAPFSDLFRHAALVVHHGGIGTAARALQAAVPQVVVPSGFDQFDNALRLERLGVAAQVPAPNCTGAVLARVTADRDVTRQCSVYGRKLASSDPTGETCSLIEQLLH